MAIVAAIIRFSSRGAMSELRSNPARLAKVPNRLFATHGLLDHGITGNWPLFPRDPSDCAAELWTASFQFSDLEKCLHQTHWVAFSEV